MASFFKSRTKSGVATILQFIDDGLCCYAFQRSVLHLTKLAEGTAVNSSYLLFDGKDSANRENNKIKTNLFYFFFRDAAYLIKIKQINVKPPNNSATFCIKTQKRHKIGFLSLFIQALPKSKQALWAWLDLGRAWIPLGKSIPERKVQ